MTEVEANFLNDPILTSAADLRTAWDPLQEGVLGTTALKVTAGTPGLSVDVASGICFVQGDAAVDQGLYRCRNDAALNSAAFQAGGLAAAHASNPRLDQIVARIYDTDMPGDTSGMRKWRLERVTGTATSGATLDNRTGAATLPGGALRLADVLVPAAATSLAAGDIRDRRPWARGAYWRFRQDTGADLTFTSTTFALLSGSFQTRLELAANTVLGARLGIEGWSGSTTLNAFTQLRVDGVSAEGTQGHRRTLPASGDIYSAHFEWTWPVPAPGSYLIAVWAKVDTGTLTVERGSDYSIYWELEERPKLPANNAESMTKLTWELCDLLGRPLAQVWDRTGAEVSISLNGSEGFEPQRSARVDLSIEDESVAMIYPLVTRLKAWLDEEPLFNGQVTVPRASPTGATIPSAPGASGQLPGLGSVTLPAADASAQLAAAYVYAMAAQSQVADTEIMARLIEHADQAATYESVVRNPVTSFPDYNSPGGQGRRRGRSMNHPAFSGQNPRPRGPRTRYPPVYGDPREGVLSHGIVRGDLTPAGQKRDRRYPDGKNIWEAIVQLSRVSGGPDFELEPVMNTEGVCARLNTFPRQGSDKRDDVVLEFGLGAHNCSSFAWEPDGTQVINHYTVVGQAQKGKIAPAYVAQQEESMELFGVWQDFQAFPDVNRIDNLKEKALGRVSAKAFPIDFFEATPVVEVGGTAQAWMRDAEGQMVRAQQGSFAVPPKFGPGDDAAYWIGDTITVRARVSHPGTYPSVDLQLYGRVTDAICHEIDSDGNIVWELTFAPHYTHAEVTGYETLVSVRDAF